MKELNKEIEKYKVLSSLGMSCSSELQRLEMERDKLVNTELDTIFSFNKYHQGDSLNIEDNRKTWGKWE